MAFVQRGPSRDVDVAMEGFFPIYCLYTIIIVIMIYFECASPRLDR